MTRDSWCAVCGDYLPTDDAPCQCHPEGWYEACTECGFCHDVLEPHPAMDLLVEALLERIRPYLEPDYVTNNVAGEAYAEDCE